MIEFEIDDAKLRKLIADSPERGDDFLDAVSEQVISEWKLSMQQTKKGGRRIRRRRKNPATEASRGAGFHTQSSPGSPPAIDFGNLINSLHWEAKGNDREFYGAEYGLFLDQEHDRPFIEAGMEKVQENDLQNIAEAIWGE